VQLSADLFVCGVAQGEEGTNSMPESQKRSI
jgi:hypothetical protein